MTWELDPQWKEALVPYTVEFRATPADAAASGSAAAPAQTQRASTLLRLELQCVRPEAILRACNVAGKRGGVNDTDPTGMQLWGLARTVSAFVAERASLVVGRSVLELGCGNGMCGLVAACCGAAHVTLTDYEPSVLALAELNAAAVAPQCEGAVDVKRLVWTRPEGVAAAAPAPAATCDNDIYTYIDNATVQDGAVEPEEACTDAVIDKLYDVQLGSELLYHETDQPALLATMSRHLAPNGVCIMAFHVRVDGLVSALKLAAEKEEMDVVFVDIDSVTTDAVTNDARGNAGGQFFALLCRRQERDALSPWMVGLVEVEASDDSAGTVSEIGGDEDAAGELVGLFGDS
eukprot:SAG31_NODE_970_length_10676_cov_12.566985_6_plen_348_part_00